MKRLLILAMIAGGSLIATTGHAQVIVHGRIGFGIPVPVPAPRVYYSTPYCPQPIVTAPVYDYGRIYPYPYYEHRRFYRDYDDHYRLYRHREFDRRRHW